MINTLDITMTGHPAYEFRLPNGDWRFFYADGFEFFWKPYKKLIVKTINLVNVESFEPFTYPLVNIDIKDKPISKFKKFWLSGWNNDKLYSIDIKVVGMKTVTKISMRSKETFIVDESVECIKNAIDACVWNAEIKEDVK